MLTVLCVGSPFGPMGYIHIKAFGHSTAASTEQAFRQLQAQGALGFIVDLRGNPGGLVQAGKAHLILCTQSCILASALLVCSTEPHCCTLPLGVDAAGQLCQLCRPRAGYQIASLLLDAGQTFCYVTNLTGPEHAEQLPSWGHPLVASPVVSLIVAVRQLTADL